MISNHATENSIHVISLQNISDLTEIDNSYSKSKKIDPIVWKWWKMMAPLMETNLDYSPVTESLETMFLYSGD